MSEDQKYVMPPNKRKTKQTAKGRNIYANLHPDYWKRKLPHLIIVIPVVWLIDEVILALVFSSLGSGVGVLAFILTIISAIFYPYSLYWYKESLIGRILNGIFYIGGFWEVIGKTIVTLIGGVVIAGVFSPIMGVLTWKNCQKRNRIIGEARDFD